MKLSEYFKTNFLIRDANISLTHYANSTYPDTICFALNEENIWKANNNQNISAIITYDKFSGLVDDSKGLVLSSSPKRDFFLFHNDLFEKNLMRLKFEPTIHPSVKLGNNVIIEKYVNIGRNVIIDHNVIIKDYSIILDGAYIGPNVVIGSRGLHNTYIDGDLFKVSDAGGVHIGSQCEILAGAIVQKSYFCEFTTIGNESIISNYTSVAHGVVIGKRNLIASNCVISGFCTIGNDTWIGPSSTISHGITVEDNASIKLGSVVIKNVKRNDEVSGNFALPHNKHIKNYIKSIR